MKVTVKNFNVSMEIKSKGIELDISDNNGAHVGDLVISKARLVWCPGKVPVKNGKRITWDAFIEYMEAK